MEQPSYYTNIPAFVRYDEELLTKPKSILLYGEIVALSNKKGYCWATNAYFASNLKVSTRMIQSYLDLLVKKKYVARKLIYKVGTKQVDKRILSIDSRPGEMSFMRGGEKDFMSPGETDFTDNITSINNTSLNKVSSSTDSKQQISAYWQKEFKTVTNGVVEEHIGNWVDEFGADLVKHYIDYSLEHQIDRSHVVSYMDSIFNRCRKEGIKSVADAKKAEQQHKEKSASRFKPYKQHKSVNKEHYHLPTNDAGLTQTEALQRILAKEAEEDRLKAEQQKKEGKS